MKVHFGTDGVRGKANQELSPEFALCLGRAAVKALIEENPHPRIVVGRDTRVSGGMLQSALVAGICSEGADAIVLDIMPTAGIAFLTGALDADAGAVISASHNPYMDNGIKFLGKGGMKLSDHTELMIERALDEVDDSYPKQVGVTRRDEELTAMYLDHILDSAEGSMEGMKIALDCANGAAYRVAPEAFEALGAEVEAVGVSPDGTNINLDCGSTNTECLTSVTLESGAEVGFAFDGDADRCICVDEKGIVRDGDFIMGALAIWMKERGELEPQLVVLTVMSNLGLVKALGARGIESIRTKVGDRYVLEEMRRTGARIGGEQSGHIIIRDLATTGDGILTAVRVASLMRESGKPLSEICGFMSKLPQVLLNVISESGRRLGPESSVWERVEQIESELGGEGRILVRSSGTEPMERVMVEAESEERATMIAEEIAEMISREIGS